MKKMVQLPAAFVLVLGLSLLCNGCSEDECGCGDPAEDIGSDTGQDQASPEDLVDPDTADVTEEDQVPPDLTEVVAPLPCIEVTPTDVVFGTATPGVARTLPVTVRSCSQEGAPLHLASIQLATDTGMSPYFSVEAGGPPSPPMVIPATEEIQFNVTFLLPEGETWDAGTLAFFGKVLVASDAPDSVVEVDLTADVASCPVAVISDLGTTPIETNTVLHLLGQDSKAFNGATVASWNWTVEAPEGAQGLFVPSASFPDPTFNVDVPGTYKFTLTVTDSKGEVNCKDATLDVNVTPKNAIFVQLLWNTPGDADPSDVGDGAGSNLDLHFAHPDAAVADLNGDGIVDPWFDSDYDCYSANPTPSFGAPESGGFQPLLVDDYDGWGPESVTLETPENLTYKVGVHYVNDHGFGPSTATLSVWIFGIQVYQMEDVPLNKGDMLYACTIEWPSGKVTAISGVDSQYDIIPNCPIP